MSTPIVSILLPTIRPDLFRVRMEEYARLELPWPCEVVVVSDRPDLDTRSANPNLMVRHAVQPRLGNVPATNLAFQMAEGVYVFATNDEVELDRQFLVALVRAGEAQGERGILSAVQEPWCSNDYYGIFFANCPFARRHYLQALNGGPYFFDPAYRCFYADPDLSMRAHVSGLPVMVVPEARCVHHCVPDADGHAVNASNYYIQDQRTFRSRWEHLGPWAGDPSQR